MAKIGAILGAMILLWALSATEARPADAPPDLVVSTQGNDAWSGRLAEPNADKTDGPLATIHRAQQLVREMRQKEPARNRPIVVQVREGTYYLPRTLAFTPEDSGSEQAPVIYEAYGRERPILSGGTRIEGWKVAEGGRWETVLADVKSGKWSFAQLFVADQRRFRPQLPKQGYYQIARQVGSTPRAEGKGFDAFGYSGNDIREDWANREDLELVIFHEWFASRMRVASIETPRRVVTFTGHTPGKSFWAALSKGHRYLVVNVREALTEPGQWYLDRPTGKLTYLPRPGEDPQKTPVIAPRLEQLVTFEGDVGQRRWVENIRLRGLTFAHANWIVPSAGQSCNQAEWSLDAAISAIGARKVTIAGCAVRHVGAYAMAFGTGCRDNLVENCEMWDLGGGGVKIGHARVGSYQKAVAPDLPDEAASHNTVRQCLIAHAGRIQPAAIGVWIGHSPHNQIEHNDIHDLYYSGLSVGWIWGYAPSQAHHNDIGFNHVHTIGQGVLSDMGGIYTLGTSTGTVIHDNCFHDVRSFGYGGWGIYTDEGSSNITIENNLSYRCKSSGFHQHYGRENQVRNNIFALCTKQQVQRSREEGHISFFFERNIVYWEQGNLLGGTFKNNNYRFDNNLYWHVPAGSFPMGKGMSWEAWRKKQDEHSLVADPLFVAPRQGDFRLQPGSPALPLGFKPFDPSKAGRSAPPVLTAGLPPVPRAFEGGDVGE